jgi:hypothetical protein
MPRGVVRAEAAHPRVGGDCSEPDDPTGKREFRRSVDLLDAIEPTRRATVVDRVAGD